jgi:hypothetical protein
MGFCSRNQTCFLQVRITEKIVICDCSDEAVQIAVNKYKAKIKEQKAKR